MTLGLADVKEEVKSCRPQCMIEAHKYLVLQSIAPDFKY
jgi:hypothetical protein